jgi:hypothetical protein
MAEVRRREDLVNHPRTHLRPVVKMVQVPVEPIVILALSASVSRSLEVVGAETRSPRLTLVASYDNLLKEVGIG